jgi:nitrate reductase assembly molybdenum cofactor insertion protein NarJ
MQTLDAMSVLLQPPTAESIAALPEVSAAIVDDAVVAPATFRELQRLFALMQQGDLTMAQKRYAYMLECTPAGRTTLIDFLACLKTRDAADRLAERGDLIEGLAAELRKRGSAYWVLFEALLSVAELGRAAAARRIARIGNAATRRTL